MKRIKDWSQIFLLGISTLLLIVNIFLIFQNLQLKSEIETLEPTKTKEGDVLSNFRAKDLSGNETKLDFGENNTKRILFFFRTTCGYCKEQMNYWKGLVSNIDRQEYKVIAITTETDTQAIRDYMKNYEIEDWEVLMINPEDAYNARLIVTPITVVVGNKGIVEKVWIGINRSESINL